MTEELKNWLDEELENNPIKKDFEELPSLKFTPNVVTEVEIDFSKPFDQWNGEQSGKSITKKIIPCSVNGVRMNWWLNVKNPIYRELLTLGKSGESKVKILATGKQADTKYVVVK